MFYFYVPSTKKGAEGWGNIALMGIKNLEKSSIATKIKVSEEDWKEYRSGHYQPSKVMPSLEIKFGAFDHILTQLKSLIASENDSSRIPSIIKGLHNTINAYKIAKVNKIWKKKDDIVYYTDFARQFIEHIKCGDIRMRGSEQKYSQKSVLSYRHTLKIFTIFESYLGRRITLEDITISMIREYISWRAKDNYLTNTVIGELSNIRIIMKYANEMGFTRNDKIFIKWHRLQREYRESIYLTPSQVKQLEELDTETVRGLLEKNKEMEYGHKLEAVDEVFDNKESLLRRIMKCRDVFLVGVYCGQRFKDYRNMTEDSIVELQGKKFIQLFQKNGIKEVYIPLDRRIPPILERYGGRLPLRKRERINDVMKYLGFLLGWTWNISTEIENRNWIGCRFCDLLSLDIARRTFATNAYEAGIPIRSIMAITGHKEEHLLKRYINKEAERLALISAKDFKGQIQQTEDI